MRTIFDSFRRLLRKPKVVIAETSQFSSFLSVSVDGKLRVSATHFDNICGELEEIFDERGPIIVSFKKWRAA
jgi:hypothetical protein